MTRALLALSIAALLAAVVLKWKEGKLILVSTFQIDGPTCVD